MNFLDKSVDFILVSSVNIRKVPRWFGPGLGKAGVFPTAIELKDNVVQQITEEVVPKLERTVKIRLKKTPNVNFSIGHALLSPMQLVSKKTLFVK
jgi:ribosomal protein L1